MDMDNNFFNGIKKRMHSALKYPIETVAVYIE